VISSKPNLELIQDLHTSEVLHGVSKKKLHNFLNLLNQRVSNLEQNYTPTFIRETPVGAIAQQSFRLAHVPLLNSLDLYKIVVGTGMVLMIPGTDYTISQNYVHLKTIPNVPLVAKYRIQ